MIYERKGQCTTNPKCDWSIDPLSFCTDLSDEQCNNESDCYLSVENNTKKCVSKGYCLNKIEGDPFLPKDTQ